MIVGNFDYCQSFVDIANSKFKCHFPSVSRFFCFRSDQLSMKLSVCLVQWSNFIVFLYPAYILGI